MYQYNAIYNFLISLPSPTPPLSLSLSLSPFLIFDLRLFCVFKVIFVASWMSLTDLCTSAHTQRPEDIGERS